MLVPVIPTIALVGFTAVAARYGLRRQWQNAVICLLCGVVAFLASERLNTNPPGLDQERRRIDALEHRASTLEARLQRMQQPNDGAGGAGDR